MVLYLVQQRYIVFFGGFKVDKDKIKHFLYPEDEPTVNNVYPGREWRPCI